MLQRPSKNDMIASLGVFVIALPLTLGIALASGVSVNSAIISAVIGGVVVGSLAGAPMAVTGPAAGLTVIVFEIVRAHGIAGLALATVICGLAQFLAGALRLGQLFKKIPHAILDGMLAAIGGMIALGQLFVVIGQPIPNGFLNSLGHLPSAFSSLFHVEGGHNASVAGLLIGIGTILILIGWERLTLKSKIIKFPIPGAIIALTVATIASTHVDVARVTINLALDQVGGGFSFLSGQSTDAWKNGIANGLLLAFVGAIESRATASGLALYAKQARGVDLTIDLNKELRAQGAGNFMSGLFGGIPVTAVIVRSAANIQFGATSRWSSILHGVWILIAVLALAPVLQMIPLPALAAVLIVTGLRLINIKVFLEHLRQNYAAGISYLATFAGVLSTNLLRGIIFGVTTASLFWIYAQIAGSSATTLNTNA